MSLLSLLQEKQNRLNTSTDSADDADEENKVLPRGDLRWPAHSEESSSIGVKREPPPGKLVASQNLFTLAHSCQRQVPREEPVA